MPKQRLQKIIASAGFCSRRKAELFITNKQVRVNGKTFDKLPVFADPEKDKITVDGQNLRLEKKVYYLLNKPKGIICTNSNKSGRDRAIDLIPSARRIYCAGRLDVDSTGLIILTNDGNLTNKLTHPSHRIPKTYIVKLDGNINAAQIGKLKKGTWLAEGKTSRSAVKILKRSMKQALIRITIREGKNRQIRRMLAKVGLKAKSLKRAKIGKLNDTGLGVGKFRKLTNSEINYLRNYDPN